MAAIAGRGESLKHDGSYVWNVGFASRLEDSPRLPR